MAGALLIGSTGATGLEIIKEAAAQGLPLKALARDPSKLGTIAGDDFEVVKGDVRDRASLANAMRGIDTVVSALGTRLILKGPVTLLSEGTRNIVAAMRDAGAGRLLCITGMGAGDSRGHGGFLYDRILLPALLGRVYADKDRQEEIVRTSGLDYTLIRPAMLVNKPGRGAWREITDWSNERRMTSIARPDVAAFIVREALEPKYPRATVNLSW